MYLRVLPVGRPQTQARCMCVPSRQFLLYMVPELDLDDTSLICRMDVQQPRENKVNQSTERAKPRKWPEDGEGSRMGGHLSFSIAVVMKVNLPVGTRAGQTVPEG